MTPESHNSGAFTIQDAVDRVRDTGGTVCLVVGQYLLESPVQLNGAKAVHIRGQGAATLLVTPGGAFSISSAIAIAIEDLAILSLGRNSAISVRTALGITLQRLVIAVFASNDARGAAIALSGAAAGAVIRDNVIVAPVGVQALDPAAPPEPKPLTFLLSALLRIDDNLLWCARQGVALAGSVLHLLGTRINGNEILGCRQGAITALGFCAPGASMKICNNSLNVNGPGITAGVDGLWIEGNKLTASVQAGSQVVNGAGITLRTGLDPDGANECQILANQIRGFADAGISIASPTRELIVKLNIIAKCGNGIVSQEEARSSHVSIENNHISDIDSARTSATEIVGVGVLRAEAAAVAGNTIQRIGLTAATSPLRAGVATIGVQRLRIADNDVSDIAPPNSFDIGLGAGILLRPPFAQADVSHNQVDRESQPLSQGGGRFIALQIGDSQGAVSKLGIFTTIQVDANTTLTFGAKRPFIDKAILVGDLAGAAQVARGANASVLGNTLGSRGTEPTARVIASGDCLFGDNRCELRGAGDAAVQLAASATIVNANRVRGGKLSIVIRGNTKNATVLGNITTGAIDLTSGGLPAPWDVLNLRG